jgi:transcriptional repressor NrdR
MGFHDRAFVQPETRFNMKCPFCGADDSKVIDTRSAGGGIRRRRECKVCGKRFTTYEQVAASLYVVKSDGRREPYERQKLLDAIRLSCAKRPIAMTAIEGLVDQVEEYVFGLGRAEVRTKIIGGKVLEHLRDLDEVGYIRYATVYLELGDLGEVRGEIDRLLTERKE